VRVIDTTLTVDYDGRVATFENQIMTGSMSEPGDSGALLVTAEGLLAVGLLFAGSQQATVFNPIQAVLHELDVVL
jgi:hypothetical protein